MSDFWLVLTMVIPAFLGAFAAGETYAIVTHRATYTEWIRRQLGLRPAAPRRAWAAPLFGFVLAGFSFWFLIHIELGVWPS